MQSQSGTLSPEKMLKQAQKTKGYLLKKSSGLLGGWNRRYFILAGGALSYYPDETLDKLKGSINLRDVSSIIMRGSSQFVLQTTKRNYEFKCERESDRDLWVASLNILKEFLSENGSAKKYIIKSDKCCKNSEKWKTKNLEFLKQTLKQVNLILLLEELEQPRVHNRIWFCRDQKHSYISVSIKSLESPEEDEELLLQKYIQPLEYNKFYKIDPNGQVQDFGKVSQMLSFKTDEKNLIIILPEQRKIHIPYEDQQYVHQISKKLCRNYEVAKEYYNPHKILLKKNVDRMVFLYQHNPRIFQEQVKYRTLESLKRYLNQSEQPVQVFLHDFRNVKKNLIEVEEALRVMNPPKDKIKISFFKVSYEIIYEQIAATWESLHQQFELQDYLNLANEIYEYWVVTNLIVTDNRLLEGCTDLNKFYLKKQGEIIKNQIQSINFSKLQVRKIKNEKLNNEITSIFFNWLKEFTATLSETVPVEPVFDQYCKFFNRSFEELTEYLTQISDKWSEASIVLGACNDISRIRQYFVKKVGPELCNGIVAETRFHNNCTNNIVSKLNDTMAHLIKRIFLIVFGSIDKKILNRPFLEIDIAKICYEVLQRLEPFKNKVIEDVDDEIILLSFDEISFFFYTCMMKKKVPQIKNLRELCVASIQKALTELEQYYCNIKTEEQVKKHLHQYLFLKQILVCSEAMIPRNAIHLRQIFGVSFNQQSLSVILQLRQLEGDVFERFYTQCCESIRNVCSSQDTVSRDSLEYHNRSRKSTLTESMFHEPHMMEMVTYAKHHREGYLTQKKITKGIPTQCSESFFRIKQKKIFQYNSATSYQVISSINLQKVDNVSLEPNGQNTFIITMGSDKYCFTSKSQDQAGKWVQAIYSEIGKPIYESKAFIIAKEKRDCLFKNYDTETATTATLRIKSLDHDEEGKILEEKRIRRLKYAKCQTPQEKIKVESPKKREKNGKPPKEQTNKKNKQVKEDEGITCCSKGFF